MTAVVTLVISAPAGELTDTIAEQLHTLDRHWDDSEMTCERVLAWLRGDGAIVPLSRHHRETRYLT